MTFSGRISQIFGFVPACVSRIQQTGWPSLYAYSKPFATFYDKRRSNVTNGGEFVVFPPVSVKRPSESRFSDGLCLHKKDGLRGAGRL